MLYGVEAQQQALGGTPPPAPYVASAVTLASAKLVLSSLACTDNQYFGFAGWFKADFTGAALNQIGFVVDPLNKYNSLFHGTSPGYAAFAIGGNNGNSFLIVQSASPPNTAWHHIICAGQTNFAAGSKVIKMKIDGADQTGSINDNAASFNAQSNGLPFYVGSDGSNFFVGSLCDLSIWPGINLLTSGDISSATVQLFRTAGGAPVDPNTAIAALGHPPIMLSGNATSFHSNSLGTAGAFSLTAGTITNASTHP